DASTKAKETNAIMEALDNAAREIGNVVTVISDIADQTNLLALNATIEAASAGEAGKGFAVVAHEVKELAKQTADATREIGEKIRLVQEQTHASVGAIQSINGTIDEISQISVVIASAIEEQNATTREVSRSVSGAAVGAGEVTSSVQKLNTAIEKEVVRGIQEAAAGVTQVSQNILGVNAAAQQTAQGADTTRRSAEQMTGLAKNLERVVAQFHV
ncbi:MAG: methyl-accepting chemotaxis protein, partial [Deltaproteobacteria bacterium]|nr:methyl-accepting chemotaxis protein [Deltaproteobacteria bacterium]